MIYITAKTQRVIQTNNFKEVQAKALEAMLTGKAFDESLVDDIKYDATITHMVNKMDALTERMDPKVVRNLSKTEERITKTINHYYSLGVNPEDDYTKFFIPKSSGGMREINAPSDDLALTHRYILNYLKNIHVLTHDAAFAYTPGRSILDAMKRHQLNKSKWFLKIDLKDFFPSCTRQLLKTNLDLVYPFAMMRPEVVDHIISISMLDGGLPQGSPLSPLLSNLVMVPFDFHMTKELYDFKKQHFVYTRYADDIIISSKYSFKFTEILEFVEKLLAQHAPGHKLNKKKTHYGSSAGRNWNLGLMLNKDNNITLGYKRKQRIRASLHQFLMQFVPANEVATSEEVITQGPFNSSEIPITRMTTSPGYTMTLSERHHTIGVIEYARSIEPDYWDKVIKALELKLGLNYNECRRQGLHQDLTL